ncbi:MAG: TadE family protein [Marmoricola sp.]
MHRVRRTESGASAVEFALVSTVLFLLLFGIIQYGLFFNDSLNTRQGVREAARQGVVQMPLSVSTCPGAGVTWTKLTCYAKDQIGAVTGDTRVHILIPDTGGWKKPNKLVICAAVKSEGAFGILPMPDGGVIMSKTAMSIEQDNAPPAGNPPNADADPSGQSWSWCS